MIRRSRSVSRMVDERQAKRYPKTFQSLVENKARRIYLKNSSALNRKLLYIPLGENSNLMHVHRDKSFEKNKKTSPQIRITMANDTSVSSRETRADTGRLLRSGTEKSIHRHEKSREILKYAEKIVAIHKENNQEIKKSTKNFHRQIKESIRGINKRLSTEGLPSIDISTKMFNRRKLQLKILPSENLLL